MTNRMTGISGLLDTESLVTATMKPYKLKVDTQKQKLQTLEWQQEQYRTIMKDSKSFYDKYLDILGTNSLGRASKYTTTEFASNNESIVTATTSDGAAVDTYTVSVEQLASKATENLSATTGNQTITIGSSTITFAADSDGTKTVANYNDKVSVRKTELNAILNDSAKTAAEKTAAKTELADLNSNTITAKYSEFTKTVSFTANTMGKGGFTLNKGVVGQEKVAADKPLIATITNSAGKEYKITAADNITTNSKTIDGVTFNFKGINATATDTAAQKLAKAATLTGKTDITSFKENIKSFVDDYNKLLSSINTKIYETRNKSYAPLTEDQKADMSDDQITKWEKKAQSGLLRKDDDLESLARSMKDAMSTMMSSTGLSLEEIGIEQIKNEYTDKHGLLKIDDAKLTNAIETNFDQVKDLFINGITENDTKNGGVITKLKDAINSGTILSTSNLVKKAGKDTGASALTNEMTKQLTDMDKKIKEMEKALITREDGLYTKYASLESALNSMQAQQNSLASYFQ